jgi:cytochrome c-type biogenesis protein CcmH/NrfG
MAESGVLWNEKKDLAGAIVCALRVASQVPELGVALLRQFGQPSPKSDGKDVPEMAQLHAVLSQNAETRPAALNNWGLALASRAETKAGEDADRLFEEAGRKYAEALRLNPDSPEALAKWGATLSGQANTKAGEEADRLSQEADRKYAEAVRLTLGISPGAQ